MKCHFHPCISLKIWLLHKVIYVKHYSYLVKDGKSCLRVESTLSDPKVGTPGYFEWGWILSNIFPVSILSRDFSSLDTITWFFFTIYMIQYTDNLMLNQPCIYGINSTWSWYILLIHCYIQSVSILLRSWHLNFWEILVCNLWGVFFCIVCLVLVSE